MANIFKTGLWNFLERISNEIIRFILNIILARLLFPEDYGMIAMIMVFLGISQSFIEGGFINALIQKQNRTDKDFSTVFYFNIFVAIVCYIILYYIAPSISKFYNLPQLTNIMRIINITIIMNSFSIVPRSIIAINLDFKKQAKATISATVISGLTSIYLALNGFGVWALVIQSIILASLSSLFLTFIVGWKPKLIFSIKSFNSLFQFGSKLLATNLINRIFANIYFIVIGKFYSLNQLGFYTRAEQLSHIPSSNIAGAIQSVTFPKMCEIQNNSSDLKDMYVNNIKYACLITFPILFFISLYSEPIVLFTLTEKWIKVAPLLTLMSITSLIYPINFLNMNLLLAKGRSGLYLKSELFKKILILMALILTVRLGIDEIIYGQIIVAFLSLIVNTYLTSKVINYNMLSQFKDILPFIFIAFFCINSSLFVSSFFIQSYLKIIFGLMASLFLYISFIYLSNFKNIRYEMFALLDKKK